MRITSWYAETTRSLHRDRGLQGEFGPRQGQHRVGHPALAGQGADAAGVGLVPGPDRAFHGALQGGAEAAAGTAGAGRRGRGRFRRAARAVRGRDLRGIDRAKRERRRHRSVSMMRVSMPRVTSSTETLAL